MPRDTSKPLASSRSVRARLYAGILIGAALLTGIGCAFLGPGDPAIVRIASLLSVWISAGWMPAAYLAGGIGWGLWCSGLIFGRDACKKGDRAAITSAVGIAATLTVTHGLGALGLLNPVTAWAWIGIGILGGASTLFRSNKQTPPRKTNIQHDRWTLVMLILGACGVGVMLAASAMPPGAQWDSEFGGYDSLSYHLQLPVEWMASGRIAPLEHNVYSYLPGYMEAATVHMACLAAMPPVDARGVAGLVSGDGRGVFAPNLLSLGMAIVGAWMIGRLILCWLARIDTDLVTAQRAAAAGAALSLLTPWTHVVGSMAYNETGVVALGAGALLAAAVPGLNPTRRGVLVAVLMGAAAGCKPTAIIFLAPACAVFMAVSARPKQWALMFSIGAVAGLLTLAPWMARNAAFGNNPVFPQAAQLFGSAHWSTEQAETYRDAHTFEGGIIDRLWMLVRPDPDTIAQAPVVSRFRGFTNPQWALTPFLGLAGTLLLLARERTHRIGFAIFAGTLLGILGWLIATHLQSRFLIPLMPLLALGFGSAVGSFHLSSRSLQRPAQHITFLLLTISLLWSITNFAQQRNARPNDLLGPGTSLFTGAFTFDQMTESIPSAWINQFRETNTDSEGGQEGSLLLIGDSAPFYFSHPNVYATVWDRHPLTRSIRDHPNNAILWTRSLRSQGISFVYISFAELNRLIESGWADPTLTPENLTMFIEQLGPPIQTWPNSGSTLYQLPISDSQADTE